MAADGPPRSRHRPAFVYIGIIGTSFLFAFYDVFDINVSFIQSCIALEHDCTPANAFRPPHPR